VAEASTNPLNNAFRSAQPTNAGPSSTPEVGDLCNNVNEWVGGVRWQQVWLQDQCRCDANPYPHIAVQSSPNWLYGPTQDQASAVGSGWVLGTAPYGNDFGIFQYEPDVNPGWVQVNGAAKEISVDFDGYPWVVNSAGTVYNWAIPNGPQIGGFEPYGSGIDAISVASVGLSGLNGSSATPATWAIDTNNQVYYWNAVGSVWSAQAGAYGKKIAIFSHGVKGDGCGPVPFVIGTDNNIYRYSCSQKTFVGIGGAAGTDITTDFVVDFNGNIDQWNWNSATPSFGFYVAAPWGTNTKIGGWVNGLFAASTTTGQIAVVSGK